MEPKVVAVIGSRNLTILELKNVKEIVVQLMDAGHYILSDGNLNVGLKVMETAYKIDPYRIFVYLHCQLKRNPSITHDILNKLPPEQVLQIPGPYNNRNIFYRNKLLVDKSDLVIAFWKDESTDVKDIIQRCKKHDPPVPVIINKLQSFLINP